MKVASIGVGNMGGAVARRLAQGFEVTVFDLDAGAMDGCVAAGANRAECLEEAVAPADVVITSLPTTALVTRTVAQASAAMTTGAIVSSP